MAVRDGHGSLRATQIDMLRSMYTSEELKFPKEPFYFTLCIQVPFESADSGIVDLELGVRLLATYPLDSPQISVTCGCLSREQSGELLRALHANLANLKEDEMQVLSAVSWIQENADQYFTRRASADGGVNSGDVPDEESADVREDADDSPLSEAQMAAAADDCAHVVVADGAEVVDAFYGEGEADGDRKESNVVAKPSTTGSVHEFRVTVFDESVQVFEGEWDAEGVYVYQAYNDEIADWALEHQRFGGPQFKPTRMTWIKPSFAWVLYRSGYGRKHNQTRILKIKLTHESIAELLSNCHCKEGGGGSNGRVQWDPARDLLSGDGNGKEPRVFLRKRAIQIGLKGPLSVLYVDMAISIQDVTDLGKRVGEAHAAKTKVKMDELLHDLPIELPYTPRCPDSALRSLGMLPGETATWVAKIGFGKTFPNG